MQKTFFEKSSANDNQEKYYKTLHRAFYRFIQETDMAKLLINDSDSFFKHLEECSRGIAQEAQEYSYNQQESKIIAQLVKKQFSQQEYDAFNKELAYKDYYKVENFPFGFAACLLQISYFKSLHQEPTLQNLQHLEWLYRDAMHKNVKLNLHYDENVHFYAINGALATQQALVCSKIEVEMNLAKIASLEIKPK